MFRTLEAQAGVVSGLDSDRHWNLQLQLNRESVGLYISALTLCWYCADDGTVILNASIITATFLQSHWQHIMASESKNVTAIQTLLFG